MSKPKSSKRLTAAIRRDLQRSRESVRQLAKRYGISTNTVQKWRGRKTVTDLPRNLPGPRAPALTTTQRAMIVALRIYVAASLDQCRTLLLPWIPHLSRSSLHRCLSRHGLSRLPQARQHVKGAAFLIYAIRLQAADGTLSIFIAVDEHTRKVEANFYDDVSVVTSVAFLDYLAQQSRSPIRRVSTRDEAWFSAGRENDKGGPGLLRDHPFDRACWRHEIEHAVLRAAFDWSAPQIESANALIRAAFRNYRGEEIRAGVRAFMGLRRS